MGRGSGSASLLKVIGNVAVRHVPATDTIEHQLPNGAWERVGGLFNLCAEITTACNMTCRNCFSHSAAGAPGNFRDVKEVMSDVEAARESYIRVGFTGGEPMLHPRFEEFISLPETYHDMVFAVSSNLTVRPDLDDALVSHGWYVWSSLHGARDAHNHYTRSRNHAVTVERIRGLAPRLPVRLNVVLHDAMCEADIDWLYAFRDECGLPMLRFAVPRPGGRHVSFDNDVLVAAVAARLDQRSELRRGSFPNGLIDVSGQSRLTE